MIDARAVVSSDAELAPDVTVGPYSIIGPQVQIGPRTVIGPHVVINGPTRIGADNRIFQFASLGDAPQDKKYHGEPTLLVIGDRNVFRESCTMNRGTTHDKGVTRIGNDNLFMAYSHVAHDCVIGDNTVFANCASLGGHVEIGDWVIVGGLSAVHQFVKIGSHAFLGGGSILSRDVPPYVMVAGNPAVPHTVNSEGLKRRGFSEEQIRNVREAYRILYRSELKLTEALARLGELAQGHAEVRPFVDFINGSTRSLVR
jgi:UDP-N-acetylglucosamine acyltransferase